MKSHPLRFAATPVEDDPVNGSRIVPPGGVISFPHHSANATGNGAGWSYPVFPALANVATLVTLALSFRSVTPLLPPRCFQSLRLAGLDVRNIPFPRGSRLYPSPAAYGSAYACGPLPNHNKCSHARRGRSGLPVGNPFGLYQINSSGSTHPKSRSARRVRRT